MPRVTDEYRSAKRDEIARAAIVAFHRKGFQATSMADIIAESGLSAGAIYGHYRSKADLIIEVAHRVIGSRVLEVAALTEQVPLQPPGRLIRVLLAGMLRDLGGPTMLLQLWGEAVTYPEVAGLATGVFLRLRETYEGYISLWQQRIHGIDAATADAIAREQAYLFISAAQGYIVQSALVKDFDGEAYLDSIEKYLPA